MLPCDSAHMKNTAIELPRNAHLINHSASSLCAASSAHIGFMSKGY